MKSPRTNYYLLAALFFGLMPNASAEVYADSDAAWAITDHYAKKHGLSYEDAKDELVESGYFKTRTRRSSANTAQAEPKETPKPVAQAETAPTPPRYEEVTTPVQASSSPQKNTVTTPKPHKTTQSTAVIAAVPTATSSVIVSSRNSTSDEESDNNTSTATKTLVPASSATASPTSTATTIATNNTVITSTVPPVTVVTSISEEAQAAIPSTQPHTVDTRMWKNMVLVGFALLILATLARFFFNRRKQTSHSENSTQPPEMPSGYLATTNITTSQLLTPHQKGNLIFYNNEDEQLVYPTLAALDVPHTETKMSNTKKENISQEQTEPLNTPKNSLFFKAIQKSLSSLAAVRYPAIISQAYAVHQTSKNVSLQTTVCNQPSGYAARQTEVNSLYAFKHLQLQSH